MVLPSHGKTVSVMLFHLSVAFQQSTEQTGERDFDCTMVVNSTLVGSTQKPEPQEHLVSTKERESDSNWQTKKHQIFKQLPHGGLPFYGKQYLNQVFDIETVLIMNSWRPSKNLQLRNSHVTIQH